MKNIFNTLSPLFILMATLLIGVGIGSLSGKKVMPRDYQMKIKGDQALIYSGDTLKGSIILFGQLDTLITKDNQ